MPRIPTDELERLKREVDLVELVRSRGVELKARGKDWVGRCPFHDEEEASFVVSPEKGLYHCFGCGSGGDAIALVMKLEGVTFRHAVELLRAGLPPSAASSPPGSVKCSTVPKLPPPFPLDVAQPEVLDHTAVFYHRALLDTRAGLDYLERRGIRDDEAVERFKIGFANRTLGYRLPQSNRRNGADIRGKLQEAGILRPNGREHLAGCVVFPLRDETGHVVGMYGRKVNDNTHKGLPNHLYLPGPHRGVFNLDALRESREVILAECIVDALSFWVSGFRNVTSTFGAGCLTDEMVEAFRAYGTERVLVAFDRDQAGDDGAAVVAKRLAPHGIGCFRVLFPRGMDANLYALKVQPAAKSLGLLLARAEWMAGPTARPSRLLVVGSRLSDNGGGGEDQLPGPGGVAAGDRPGAEAVQTPRRLPEARDLRAGGPDPEGGGVDPGEHRRGPGEAAPEGVSPAPLDCQGQPGGADHAPHSGPEPGLPERAAADGDGGRAGPDRPAPQWPHEPPAAQLTPTTNNQQPTTTRGDEVVIRLGDRRWRVRGLGKNLSYELLRVNLLLARDGEPPAFHVDTLDLYVAKQRAAFVKQAAAELGVKEDVVKKDLARVLLKLEELRDEQVKAALAPKPDPVASLSSEEREEALAFLKAPDLVERVLADFDTCGLVGEETNKLVGYLAAVSRKLARPLGVLVQSSSAAGKTALMEAVLAFVPEEERAQYSAMTGQSLFYMGETDLKHKVLAVAEEQGAERATYPLKLLLSEGKLSIASTGKDPATGKLVTHTYKVEGPVAGFFTTTAIELDEELRNRCVLLTVDEGAEQTRAIHRLQREQETLAGQLKEDDKAELLKLHHNAQRLLKPLAVHNPFAPELTFFAEKTRARRDHVKYLTLIRAIALLHQHQRPVRTTTHRGRRTDYVEVTLSDVELANRLAAEVLGRTLDELPPQTRLFLDLVHRWVTMRCQELEMDRTSFRFRCRDVREATGWSNPQVRRHLERLVELEYVLVHRGGRGQSFVYELLWDGEGREGEPFLIGIVDPEALRGALPTTESVTPCGGTVTPEAAKCDPPMTPLSPPLDPPVTPSATPSLQETSAGKTAETPENAHWGVSQKSPSYQQATVVGPARQPAAGAASAGARNPKAEPGPDPTTNNPQPTTGRQGGGHA